MKRRICFTYFDQNDKVLCYRFCNTTREAQAAFNRMKECEYPSVKYYMEGYFEE